MNDTAAKTPGNFWWRLLLILWFVWLLALAALSIKEWKQPRPLGGPRSRQIIS